MEYNVDVTPKSFDVQMGGESANGAAQSAIKLVDSETQEIYLLSINNGFLTIQKQI